MTGGHLVCEYLIRQFPAIVAIVPLDRIKEDVMPEGTPFPHIIVRTISSMPRQPLKRGIWTRIVDRASVTVKARNAPQRDELIGLVVNCCMGRVGDFGPVRRASITSAGIGPCFIGQNNSFERAADFRASFDMQF